MKKLLVIIFTFALFIPIAHAADFPDVSTIHNNYVAVKYLSENGIISGYPDGTFKPDQLVNRAEALKIILEGFGAEIPETVTETAYSDVQPSDWFAGYVMGATDLGIVNGNPDGTFAPARNVARAELMKIILLTNAFKTEKWENQNLFSDVPEDAWFASYMNYAGTAGLLTPDSQNNLYPGKDLNRGEVAEIAYIMTVILKGQDTQFLIDQAEAQMVQIDLYLNDKKPYSAKRAADLAVDMTQQALMNLPGDNIVLGVAKLARAYDFVVDAYLELLKQNYEGARDWANQAIDKATEAWEINNETQPFAKHIKDQANSILEQLPT